MLSNGQSVTCYYGSSQAVGSDIAVDATGGIADVNTTTRAFQVKSPAQIRDFVTDQTAGAMEIINQTKGQATGVIIRTTAQYAVSVANRPVPPAILQPGNWYSFRMRVAGAA